MTLNILWRNIDGRINLISHRQYRLYLILCCLKCLHSICEPPILWFDFTNDIVWQKVDFYPEILVNRWHYPIFTPNFIRCGALHRTANCLKYAEITISEHGFSALFCCTKFYFGRIGVKLMTCFWAVSLLLDHVRNESKIYLLSNVSVCIFVHFFSGAITHAI